MVLDSVRRTRDVHIDISPQLDDRSEDSSELSTLQSRQLRTDDFEVDLPDVSCRLDLRDEVVELEVDSGSVVFEGLLPGFVCLFAETGPDQSPQIPRVDFKLDSRPTETVPWFPEVGQFVFEGIWEVDRTEGVFAAALKPCRYYVVKSDSCEHGQEWLGFLVDGFACDQYVWVELLIWLAGIPGEEYVVDDQSNLWGYGMDEGTRGWSYRDCCGGMLEALHGGVSTVWSSK